MGTQLMHSSGATLADVVERILDKGLVINADITVSLVGVELLGIKIRAAIASFETAARYGLEFPGGFKLQDRTWQSGPPVSNNGHHEESVAFAST